MSRESVAGETSTRQISGERQAILRRFPIGSECTPGGVHFRVWAPRAQQVSVELCDRADYRGDEARLVSLKREPGGYFSGEGAGAVPGEFYRFKLPGGSFPDPASRFQPLGPHGPSQIVAPGHSWTDENWPGVNRRRQVIYELHIGTFTPEGTWAAALKRLESLADLGITIVELMPVADFPGGFGWGYDGVNLFAPTRLYGTPDEFRAFVDRAHRLGVGVILDVVYNHFGPDGNYLKHFSGDYLTDRYRNEWGDAINFDGENSGPVREFFLCNAAYWISEFHLDGLRLDATQQIFDASPAHILQEITSRVREAGEGRSTYVVGENEPQQTKLLREPRAGGCGLDALWNDDFHHSAMVALTGRNEAYYSDYRGTPQEFVSGAKHGYLYQGQWYSWQKKSRGSSTRGLPPEQLINYLQNHDQVANSLRGMRLHQLASAGQWKALTALLLLGPATPMLFQGQEFAAAAPFLYFADHNPDLARLVARGRREFLGQFPSIACPESSPYVAQPGARETFERCKLDWSELKAHEEARRLHCDLLRLRREDPVFSRPRLAGLDGAVLGGDAFVLRFFGEEGKDRLLLVNLGLDLKLSPAAEPLLAPVEGMRWELMWSSEAPQYGGCGTPLLQTEGEWRVLGKAAVVLRPAPGWTKESYSGSGNGEPDTHG